MTSRSISQESAVRFLFQFGKKRDPHNADAERIFRDECERYVSVQIESHQELIRLDRLEDFLTDGRSFHLAVIAPGKTIADLKNSKSCVSGFLSRAVRRYWCESEDGTTRILIGVLLEELQHSLSDDVFIDLLERQRQEKKAQIEQRAQEMPRMQSRSFSNVRPVDFRRYSG